MATKRKVKRFDEGGMSEEDVRSFAGTPENDSNAGMAEASEPAPAKKMSFKEAFAAARGAGDKSFEWNGKKFTTEMAKPKAAAAPAAKAEAPAKPKGETAYDRMNRENRESGKDFDSLVGKLKDRIATAGSRGSALPLKSTKSETGNKFMGSTGLKSGGSVKGWGQARGARKAKIY
jgi:hypothetical protein